MKSSNLINHICRKLEMTKPKANWSQRPRWHISNIALYLQTTKGWLTNIVIWIYLKSQRTFYTIFLTPKNYSNLIVWNSISNFVILYLLKTKKRKLIRKQLFKKKTLTYTLHAFYCGGRDLGQECFTLDWHIISLLEIYFVKCLQKTKVYHFIGREK